MEKQPARTQTLMEHSLDRIAFGARLLVALVFLYSGLSHASNQFEFFQSVIAYQILSTEWAVIVASMLPLLQLTIGLLLLTDTCTESASYLSAALFGLFGIAGAHAVFQDLDITCGCFGDLSPKVSLFHVCVAILAATTMTILTIYESKRKRCDVCLEKSSA